MSQEQSQPAEREQVLEFRLGDEIYCVSIDYVTEIVEMGELTRIPNAPPHVEGIIDLRGATTAIVDPKVGLDIDGEIGERIVIFDSQLFDDDRSIGWAVDSVEEVSEVTPEEVDDSPVARSHVRSLIKRDSEFVVWVDPESIDDAFSDSSEAAAKVAPDQQ